MKDYSIELLESKIKKLEKELEKETKDKIKILVELKFLQNEIIKKKQESLTIFDIYSF